MNIHKTILNLIVVFHCFAVLWGVFIILPDPGSSNKLITLFLIIANALFIFWNRALYKAESFKK